MNRTIVSLVLCSILGTIQCSATGVDTIEVKSAVSAVNVFFEGARVTRSVRINLEGGRHLLSVRGLPPDIDPELIKVKCPFGSKILSVAHAVKKPSRRSVETELNRLNEHKIDLEDQVDLLRSQKEVYEMEKRILMANIELKKSAGSTFTEGVKQAADFYRERLSELARLSHEQTQAIRVLQDSIKAMNASTNRLLTGLEIPKSHLLLLIEAEQSIGGDLLIEYFTMGAGWEPLYDFRFESIDEPLRLVYNANVYQSSGEDWKEVKLTLTEGLPKQKAVLPKFERYYLDQKPRRSSVSSRTEYQRGAGSIRGTLIDAETGEPLPFVNLVLMQENRMIMGVATDFDGKYSIKPVPSGNYDVEVSYVGYNPKKVEGVNVSDDRITFLDLELESGVKLEEFAVIEYSKPLIDKDGGASGGTIRREDIRSMPGRNVRGALPRAAATTSYYIDGVKVRGAAHAPSIYVDESISISSPRITYTIPHSYTVPSNGNDRLLTIKTEKVEVEFLYRAIPRLDTDVYLLARINDWGKLNLLSGKSTIYFQGAYSGESMIESQNLSDTLEIALGRDENILLERRLDTERSAEAAFGSKVKRELHWEIKVRNKKAHPIRLELIDQIPLSTSDKIEVELLYAENAEIEVKTGKLRWELELKADSSRKVAFAYELKYPQTAMTFDL